MDIFDFKKVKPMLIKYAEAPFNSVDYIYELKLDGIRCIAYLDKGGTELRTRNNLSLIRRFPELSQIHKQVVDKCILDGELVVIKNEVPDFFEVQRRIILNDNFKIQLASKQLPASYVAFDILYYADKEVSDRQLMVRKSLLETCINENSRIAISRFIEERGIELYQAAESKKLEGVVAKKKDSLYLQDKKSKDWIKFKRLADEDCVICGYVLKRPMNALILGQYIEDKLVYRGSVSFGVNLNFLREYKCKPLSYSPFTGEPENRMDGETGVFWIEPSIVCTIEYMPNTKDSLRQSVFKGIREDILPKECKVVL